MVHSIRLPLHARHTPELVTRSIAAQVLHPFSVVNHPGVFVYREKGGNVFYIRMWVSTEGDRNEGEPAQATTR